VTRPIACALRGHGGVAWADLAFVPCWLPAASTATVQDFLDVYEVGETVGVGGEWCLDPLASSLGRPRTDALLALSVVYACPESSVYPATIEHPLTRGALRLLPACSRIAGFAVVKKGRDKRTGEPVAIKVWKPCRFIR